MADKDAKAADTDQRERFRQALERKRTQQADRAAETQGESKIHSAHGPAGAKRAFRRKSG